jgi:hypothetical protein
MKSKTTIDEVRKYENLFSRKALGKPLLLNDSGLFPRTLTAIKMKNTTRVLA